MGQAIWIDGITSCVMLSINEFQQIWPNFDCNWVRALVFRLSDGVWTRFPLTDCDGDADCRYFNIPTWADSAFAKWMLGWAMNIKEKHRNMEQLQNSNRFFANVSYHIRHGCSEYAYDERYLHRAHCTVHVNEKKNKVISTRISKWRTYEKKNETQYWGAWISTYLHRRLYTIDKTGTYPNPFVGKRQTANCTLCMNVNKFWTNSVCILKMVRLNAAQFAMRISRRRWNMRGIFIRTASCIKWNAFSLFYRAPCTSKQ